MIRDLLALNSDRNPCRKTTESLWHEGDTGRKNLASLVVAFFWLYAAYDLVEQGVHPVGKWLELSVWALQNVVPILNLVDLEANKLVVVLVGEAALSDNTDEGLKDLAVLSGELDLCALGDVVWKSWTLVWMLDGWLGGERELWGHVPGELFRL